ncbi:transposase [Streptomyces nojiriensis]|uniref:transposase n=1 Tax=Streptomyces nojiriensis TaxID=66374 RepID=UPI0039996E10
MRLPDRIGRRIRRDPPPARRREPLAGLRPVEPPTGRTGPSRSRGSSDRRLMPSGYASSRSCRTGHRGRGGRWRDHRQVIDAIAFKYRTGTPWMDLPEQFGSWKDVHSLRCTWGRPSTSDHRSHRGEPAA